MSTNFVRDYQAASKPQIFEQLSKTGLGIHEFSSQGGRSRLCTFWWEGVAWSLSRREHQETCTVGGRTGCTRYLCRSHAFGVSFLYDTT